MSKKTITKLKGPSLYVKRPIAQVVSKRLGILIFTITILVSAISYFYSMDTVEGLAREQLMEIGRAHV